MKVAIVQFPGSNADYDALAAFEDVLGVDARYVFHKETTLGDADVVVVPGGFSYGDYLRPGAIACFSPIVPALRAFAAGGGPVLGICNGFQILTELGLLPGALTRNAHVRFECRTVHVRVDATGPFTAGLEGRVLALPIAHADGRYHASDDVLARLVDEGRVAFRYVTADGLETAAANPNGSMANIAGIYGEGRNVLGLMPHPERACEAWVGSDDGLAIFRALLARVDGAPTSTRKPNA